MHANSRTGRTFLALGAVVLLGCQASLGQNPGAGPQSSNVHSVEEQREGDRKHEQIIARFGVYDEGQTSAYVDRIGQRLARVSERPDAAWTFPVLDTPSVTAFATAGGYIYVTRGLIVLAGDEAQLAGVIAHEIAHVTAGHLAQRRDRNTAAGLLVIIGGTALALLGGDPNLVTNAINLSEPVAGGLLAAYSRRDELEADNLAIGYLARAGYDPHAQAEFLRRLSAWADLHERIAQRNYDPNRVDFFASHPASAPRIRHAIQLAQQTSASTPGRTHRDRFLNAIDGMIYGDNPQDGFVYGRSFTHPSLRFTYTVPLHFEFVTSPGSVIARGPDDSHFIMNVAQDQPGPLTDYIRHAQVSEILQEGRKGQLQTLRAERINNLDAASAVISVEHEDRDYQVFLVAYRLGGRIYRVTGLAPLGSGLLPEMRKAARTFRELTVDEVARLREKRIMIVSVEDDVEAMAQRMNFADHRIERFRALNGLISGQTVRAGERVKIVR